jgi:sulfur carrier protein ThiS
VNITVKLSRTNETKVIDIEKGSTIQNILIKMNMKPDTLIVMNKNNPVPIDNEVEGGEELTIIQVSSGG